MPRVAGLSPTFLPGTALPESVPECGSIQSVGSYSSNTTVPAPVNPAVQHAAEFQKKIEPAVQLAMKAYRTANNGGAPKNFEALTPYFATPQEGADFVEFLEAVTQLQAQSGVNK